MVDGHAVDVINSRQFWNDLEDLEAVIKPIHEGQVQSEADKAHIGRVINRWNNIFATWHVVESSGQYPHIDFEELRRIFAKRYLKQHKPINYAAWALDPENVSSRMTAETWQKALEALEQYIPPSEYSEAVEAFFSFRAKEGIFAPWRDI